MVDDEHDDDHDHDDDDHDDHDHDDNVGSSERKLPLSSAILWPGVCGALKTSFSGLSLKVRMTMMISMMMVHK